MTLFWILVVLLLALIVLVPLIERFGPRMSSGEINKLGRFILPLVAVLLVLQLLRYMFS